MTATSLGGSLPREINGNDSNVPRVIGKTRAIPAHLGKTARLTGAIWVEIRPNSFDALNLSVYIIGSRQGIYLQEGNRMLLPS